MKLWYMRDNHTFRALPVDDVDAALAAIEDELHDGFTSGMLCATPHGEMESLHAHYNELGLFRHDARMWLAKAKRVAECAAFCGPTAYSRSPDPFA